MNDPQAGSGDFSAADQALLELLRLLAKRHYRFVTPTPATHAHVVARPHRGWGRPLEDVLGWSLPFAKDALPSEISDLLRSADAIGETAEGLRSRVRVSSLGDTLFLHSAYPTTAADAVFFGPDSYRFAAALRRELACRPTRAGDRIVDIGTGSGVGAIVAAQACRNVSVTMTDINAQALRLARINAVAAGIAAEAIETRGLAGVDGPFDLVTTNPPFIIDADARAYRHGGAMHGGQLSLDLTLEALDKLAPGGRVVLYTGSAIVGGTDGLRQALGDAAASRSCVMVYEEIDPDVFGEEMDKDCYRDVDRIALVTAVITREG